MVTVSGTATKRDGINSSPAEGVMVAAYRNNDPNTAVATATTDANGMYSLVIETGGTAVDGYLKATLSGFLDTYLYPPAPLAEDFDSASLNIVNQSTLDLLSGTLCGSLQESTNGVIGVLVVDSTNAPVAGAMISSSPAAQKYCYNESGLPNKNATMTDTDGIGYMANVAAGNVTVSATKSGLTFSSHSINARAGVLTTTVVQP